MGLPHYRDGRLCWEVLCSTTGQHALTSFPETISLCSMAKTNQERLQALRAKRDAAGWKRFEVWCHPLDWPTVKRYVERLRKRRNAK